MAVVVAFAGWFGLLAISLVWNPDWAYDTAWLFVAAIVLTFAVAALVAALAALDPMRVCLMTLVSGLVEWPILFIATIYYFAANGAFS